MTQDQYNKAGLILEQIKTAENLKDDIQKQYNIFKNFIASKHNSIPYS